VAHAVTARRAASLAVGCALVALALSPVSGDAHGDHDGQVGHMARHVLLGMLAPVFLALGAPGTAVLRASGPAVRRRLAAVLRSTPVHVLTHPVTAAVLDIGGLYVVVLAGVHPHPLLYAHYLAAGYLFAWSIAGPDPAPRRPGPVTRVVVLVAAAAAHAVLAKHLYATATDDEGRTAALVMYYGGDLAELLLAVALFSWWFRRLRVTGRRQRARSRPSCA
jgi:putative membrane protein